MTGPKTRQIPPQEALTTFAKNQIMMNIDLTWTHIRLLGLRIKHVEPPRCYESNGTPPDPPKLPYKIQNPEKIQPTPLGKVYTNLFRQPYVSIKCSVLRFLLVAVGD